MSAAGPFLRPSHPRRRRRQSIFGRAARWMVRFLPALVLPAAAWFWVSGGDTFALAADQAIVTEVYGSRESPIEGVNGELVVTAARASGHKNVTFCPDWADARGLLAASVSEGDAILTLGAGDVYRLARKLAEEEA